MVDKDILQSIRTAIENPDPDETVKAVEKAVDSGVAPLEIVGALTDGITTLGDKFERMECFLPELILGADAMDASMKLLKPKMEELNLEAGPAGTVVISNIQGDIHDIGRDIVVTMLRVGILGFRKLQ
jgi:methanogenic corrinoid protein MtbC1